MPSTARAARRGSRARREDDARDDLAARGLDRGRPPAARADRAAASPTSRGLRSFLAQNGIPHQLLDPAPNTVARVHRALRPEPEQLRLAVGPDGEVLRNPSESELARCIACSTPEPADMVYDVRHRGRSPPGSPPRCNAGSKGSRCW